jgi:murein tripeptide amidase MpaA
MNSYRTIADTTSVTQIPAISSIVFMARQHPGESQGSYVLEGVVDWLIENEHEGWKKNFNVYIVPMINMDGVYYGNYRTNLSGNDLNRVWRQPRKDYHC